MVNIKYKHINEYWHHYKFINFAKNNFYLLHGNSADQLVGSNVVYRAPWGKKPMEKEQFLKIKKILIGYQISILWKIL